MNRNHLLWPQAIERLEGEAKYLKDLAANYSQQDRMRFNSLRNLERVRSYYEDHPGCTQKHASRALNLTITQVQIAVTKLRATWKDR